nr:hypothetical protein [Natrinema saccharevitans]
MSAMRFAGETCVTARVNELDFSVETEKGERLRDRVHEIED